MIRGPSSELWRSMTMTLRRSRLPAKVMTAARRGEMRPWARSKTILESSSLMWFAFVRSGGLSLGRSAKRSAERSVSSEAVLGWSA